jgi:hypothetical protein
VAGAFAEHVRRLVRIDPQQAEDLAPADLRAAKPAQMLREHRWIAPPTHEWPAYAFASFARIGLDNLIQRTFGYRGSLGSGPINGIPLALAL